jgi:hypothetical protein
VCAIGFGLTLGADLDHRDQELTIGENSYVWLLDVTICSYIHALYIYAHKDWVDDHHGSSICMPYPSIQIFKLTHISVCFIHMLIALFISNVFMYCMYCKSLFLHSRFIIRHIHICILVYILYIIYINIYIYIYRNLLFPGWIGKHGLLFRT